MWLQMQSQSVLILQPARQSDELSAEIGMFENLSLPSETKQSEKALRLLGLRKP